jgi:hypothetical protein
MFLNRMVYANLKQLHEDDLLRLQRLVPFSECEDAILMTLYSSSVPFSRTSNTDESRNEDGQDADLHFFEQLLVKYRCFGNGSGFHAARTPLQLRHRYALFKKLGLLVDQEFELMTSTTSSSASGRILSTASVLNLNSDKREKENSEYGGNIDSMIQQEIEFDENIENGDSIFFYLVINFIKRYTYDMNFKEMSQEYELLQRQIRRAEVDVALWQIVCSSAVDKNRNGFNNDAKEGEDTLAVLFVLEEAGDYDQDESEETAGEKRKSCQGKSRCHYYYSMRKREIRAGRGSDCDLRLPSSTAMSRHQFSIQAAAAVDLKDTNDETLPAASVFYLINTGKRLMYVDGKPLRGAMQAAGSKNQVGARGDRSRLFDKSVIEVEIVHLI